MHSVIINSREFCYEAIMFWVTDAILKGKPRNSRIVNSKDAEYDGPLDESILFETGEGYHFGWLNKRPILIYKNKEKDTNDRPTGRYELEIVFVGSGTKAIRNIILSAMKYYETNYPKTINAYFPDVYGSGGWTKNTSSPLKLMSSLALSGSIANEVVNDVANFKDAREDYSEYGMIYKRTYLLYGSPGTGKSSLVQGISTKFLMNIYCLDLHNVTGGNELVSLINSVPNNSIILFEDIDCVTANREEEVSKEKAGKSKVPVSLSTLLNVLDGLQTREGCIYFLTTNYKDRLDPALIRPGRVDLQIEMGHANVLQMEELFNKFFPDASTVELGGFIDTCLQENDVIAKVHQRLIDMKFNTQKVLKDEKPIKELPPNPPPSVPLRK